jgi:hypothetical protein
MVRFRNLPVNFDTDTTGELERRASELATRDVAVVNTENSH